MSTRNEEVRAAAGASFLDQSRPGWHRQIDTGTLHIARSDRCALGQLYGSYHRGLEVLHVAPRSAELGFSAMGGSANIDEYGALTEAWKREIDARLDAERAQWAVEQAEPKQWTFRKVPVGV